MKKHGETWFVMNRPKIGLISLAVLFLFGGWGFFSHRQVNYMAIQMLPSGMARFFKKHSDYLREAAVNPDRRRYAVKGEAECHFMDMDHYEKHELDSMSKMEWNTAVEVFGEDSLRMHGILPWNLIRVYRSLREAFTIGDPARILRLSADLGHYAGDAHVPLHTTSNYDGQQTGQHGLHGLWESRLPELHFQDYDFLIGNASYIPNIRARIWQVLRESQSLVDSVLVIERALSESQGGRKHSFESRGSQTIRVVSENYAHTYHRMLDGMVERRMKASIRLVADLWYSAWLEAGQPELPDVPISEEELARRRADLEEWKGRYVVPARQHETEP